MNPGPLFQPDQPLRETVFAVFDVETTGLSPAYGHRICEIACLRFCDGLELDRFESLVDPGRPISAGAFRVNRITSDMLLDTPVFAGVARPLLELMHGAVLVAHNAAFDLGFLAAELEIAQLPPPEGPVVDTLALVRRTYHFSSNSLGAVAHALQVEGGPAHRAMGDVATTWHVLEQILWELESRWGVKTLGRLLEFQGGSVPYPHAHTLPLPPAIAEAMQSGGHVQMRYIDARGAETVRMVRPLRIQEQRGHLYLLGHCFRAEALRTFRLDRVVEMGPGDSTEKAAGP